MPNHTPPRIPDHLREISDQLRAWYPGYEFVLVGHPPNGDKRRVIRIPCPAATAAPPPATTSSGADKILETLGDADGPLTLRELAKRALGNGPTGAFRATLKDLIADGQVRETSDKPKRYELPD